MRTHREIRFAVLSLLALQALTAVVGVLLLGRLGPAVDHILENNEFSLEAVAEAEAVLVESPGRLGVAETQRLTEAVGRAAQNITEAEEPPHIATLQTHLAGTVAGRAEDRQIFHQSLQELARINREAMHASAEKAGRFARAGAWTLVVLALVTLTVGLIVLGRARQRLLEPLDRLTSVAQAWRRGDHLRRTGLVDEEAADVAVVASVLDQLLDQAAARGRVAGDGTGVAQRTALLALLETRPGRAAVVDAEGGVVAANLAALDHLGSLGRALRGEVPAVVTELAAGVRLVEAWGVVG